MSVRVTVKGLALLAADEAGLIPHVSEGLDITKFSAFWTAFEKSLTARGVDPEDEFLKVLNKKRDSAAKKEQKEFPRSHAPVLFLVLGPLTAR